MRSGHFDDQLGNANIELPAHLHQLVIHLRHRNVMRRNEQHGVDNLLTVRRWSLSCGLTPARRSGRAPSVSSSNKSKSTESTLELTVFWLRKASFDSGPAPLYAEWCRAAANSMRTVIRSCRSHERSQRSLLRRPEPTSRSAMSKPTVKVLEMWSTTKEYTRAKTLGGGVVQMTKETACLSKLVPTYS